MSILRAFALVCCLFATVKGAEVDGRRRRPPPPRSPPPPPPSFSQNIHHFKLSLSWSGSFCLVNNCGEERNKRVVSGLSSFTIHGLWAEEQKGSRFEHYNYCGADEEFGVNDFPRLVPDLKIYWPDLKNYQHPNMYFIFWREEWDKHGKCCVPMFNTTLYFKHSLNLVKGVDFKGMLKAAGISPGTQPLTPAMVRAAFSGKEHIKEPFIHCNPRIPDTLTELRFCVTKDTATFIDCKTLDGREHDCAASIKFL